MKRILSLALPLLLASGNCFAQWQPAGERIKTEWATQIDPAHVLPEYPRPQMERAQWQNLNGLWQYAVVPKDAAMPDEFEGEILVPFAIESSLSGVGRRLDDKSELVYSRTFTVPSDWRGQRVLLHFGAVDWKADVWVNDVKVGSHEGGFTPFSFDVTAALVGKSGINRPCVGSH